MSRIITFIFFLLAFNSGKSMYEEHYDYPSNNSTLETTSFEKFFGKKIDKDGAYIRSITHCFKMKNLGKAGKGDTGSVYKTSCNKKNFPFHTEKDYAVKLLKSEKYHDNLIDEYGEILLLHITPHNNIVTPYLYIYFNNETNIYNYILTKEELIKTKKHLKKCFIKVIFFEFIKLDDLKKTIEQLATTLPEQKDRVTFIFNLFITLCSTLQHIHTHKIIHCDLKPQNILVNAENFQLKIVDFGLSQSFAHSPKHQHGSLYSKAPEVITDSQYDHTVDIWSLGMIFYFSLCGKFPLDHFPFNEGIYQNDGKTLSCEIVKQQMLAFGSKSSEDKKRIIREQSLDLFPNCPAILIDITSSFINSRSSDRLSLERAEMMLREGAKGYEIHI